MPASNGLKPSRMKDWIIDMVHKTKRISSVYHILYTCIHAYMSTYVYTYHICMESRVVLLRCIDTISVLFPLGFVDDVFTKLLNRCWPFDAI